MNKKLIKEIFEHIVNLNTLLFYKIAMLTFGLSLLLVPFALILVLAGKPIGFALLIHYILLFIDYKKNG